MIFLDGSGILCLQGELKDQLVATALRAISSASHVAPHNFIFYRQT